MAMFKHDLIRKIQRGEKTQTRRRHSRWRIGKTYKLKHDFYTSAGGSILILRKWRQRLGDVTEQEAKAEGFRNLAAFKERWVEINGGWDSNEVVTAYEFKFIPDAEGT